MIDAWFWFLYKYILSIFAYSYENMFQTQCLINITLNFHKTPYSSLEKCKIKQEKISNNILKQVTTKLNHKMWISFFATN